MVLLPLVMVAARRAALAEGRARRWWQVALVMTVALWAQCHPSVFIAPWVAILAALPWHPGERRPVSGFGLGGDGLLVMALVAVMPLTGTDGFGIFSRVLAHRGGDAARHIVEMRPTTLQHWLDPSFAFLLVQGLLLVAILGC